MVEVFHNGNLPEERSCRAPTAPAALRPPLRRRVHWLRRHSRHLVFADFAPDDDVDDSVMSDVSVAMNRLLQGIYGMGYRLIGFLWIDAFRDKDDIHSERRCAFIHWMTKAGLYDPELCIIEKTSGYTLAKAMLSKPNPPKILVTCNDNMAIGAYRAIHEMGLSDP